MFNKLVLGLFFSLGFCFVFSPVSSAGVVEPPQVYGFVPLVFSPPVSSAGAVEPLHSSTGASGFLNPYDFLLPPLLRTNVKKRRKKIILSRLFLCFLVLVFLCIVSMKEKNRRFLMVPKNLVRVLVC